MVNFCNLEMKKTLLYFVFIFDFIMIIAFLAGCTVKGYEGPERPDDEISEITIRSSGPAEILSVSIDDKRIGGFGNTYQVLPAAHTFDIEYRFEDRSACQYDERGCYGYVEYGSCQGTITTKAGRAYLITIENYFALIRGNVAAKGYFDLFEREDEQNIGSISCSSLN